MGDRNDSCGSLHKTSMTVQPIGRFIKSFYQNNNIGWLDLNKFMTHPMRLFHAIIKYDDLWRMTCPSSSKLLALHCELWIRQSHYWWLTRHINCWDISHETAMAVQRIGDQSNHSIKRWLWWMNRSSYVGYGYCRATIDYLPPDNPVLVESAKHQDILARNICKLLVCRSQCAHFDRWFGISLAWLKALQWSN